MTSNLLFFVSLSKGMADAHARRQCIQQERKKRRETCANAHEEVPKRMLAILTDTSHLAPWSALVCL